MNTTLRPLALCALLGIPVIAAAQHEGHGQHQGHQSPPPAAASQHAGHDQHQGHQSPPATAAGGDAKKPLPAGYAAVAIDPGRASAMQLTTAPVEMRDFTRTVRTVGVVALDETRTAHVHSRVRGWIEDIRVDFVGRKVAAGETLCSIYSQEVYAAETELVALLDRAAGPAPDPLLEAARKRLALWDVPREEIARLERTREPRRTFPLVAPRAGVVVAKAAISGTYVDPSAELYTLSDLSRVWVLVDVYEADVPYVRPGDVAKLKVEGQTAPLEAKVAFLAPTIDEATRTRKVRLELDNRGGLLLPGAFVSAELRLPVGRGLAVPESAVIRTGARSIVFVAHGDPASHFEPREVALGPLVGDRYRVESGVADGERVATGAQFLLDSESRLRATSDSGGGHVHAH